MPEDGKDRDGLPAGDENPGADSDTSIITRTVAWPLQKEGDSMLSEGA